MAGIGRKIAGGTLGGLGAAALGLGGMAASVAGAMPLVAGAGVIGAGAKKGAGLFSGAGASDKDEETKEAYAGLNLDILNAIYKEVVGIKSVLVGSDPKSEKKELALDAEVKHRELLEALMSGFGGGGEGEKKKDGLFSWLLPALGGLLVALGLGDLTKVIENLGKYVEAIGQALSNIHEFFTDIDNFFAGLGIEFAGAAILGYIKGMKVWAAIEKLKTRLKGFGDRMAERFKNWRTKFGEWSDRLNKRWTKIKDGFKTRMTGIIDAFDRLKNRMGQYRTELGVRLKSIREGFAKRWTTLKEGFKTRMTGITDAFDRLKTRMGQYRIELSERLKGIREGFAKRWTTLREGFKTRMAGITDAFERLKNRMGQYRIELSERLKGIRAGFAERWKTLKTGFTERMGKMGDAFDDWQRRLGKRFSFLSKRIGVLGTRASGAIMKGLGAIDDGIKNISKSLGKAIGDIDAKVTSAFKTMSGHFESLKNRLTSLLPKPKPKPTGMQTRRGGGRTTRLSAGTLSYLKGIGKGVSGGTAAKALTGGGSKTSVANTKYGQGYDAIDWTKKGDKAGSKSMRPAAGGAGTQGTGGMDKASQNLMKFLNSHPWIKKILKGLGKGAAVIGWGMMAMEIYGAMSNWLDTRDKDNPDRWWGPSGDLDPMGEDPADKVFQKTMARIAAGYGGAMFGSIAGGMIGTMLGTAIPGVGNVLGGVAGSLVGGFGGYMAGDSLAEWFQGKESTEADPAASITPSKSIAAGDVGGDEAAMAAFGPQHDNITIIQQNNNDNRQNQVNNQNAQTTVNAGLGGGNVNRNPSGYKASTAASPFAGRYP